MSQAKHDSIHISRRAAIAGAVAAAAVPIAAVESAAAEADPIAVEALTRVEFAAAALARTEQVIEVLRTGHVCRGWTLDEEAAARTLDYFRRGMPEDDPELEAAIRFFGDHGQSLDWIFRGEPSAMICDAAARSSRAADLRRRRRALAMRRKHSKTA